ncbi:diacylglycerol/lipid kinase family protein [Planctomycetaceae bacterium SH139]
MDKQIRTFESRSGSLGLDGASGGEMRAGDRVLIASSPKAGSGQGRQLIEQIRAELTAAGVIVTVETDLLAIDRWLAAGEQRGCVIAAGGDGTVNLLASRLSAEVPIMPLPLGTENLLARHYGMFVGRRLPAASWFTEVVLRGRTEVIDAGLARFLGSGRQQPRERMFLIMASVGFDAEVVRRMHLTRRGHIRRWSYFKPIWSMLRNYRYPLVRVRAEGLLNQVADGAVADASGAELAAVESQVAWALVFNLPRYAASLAIESAADATDGKLDFCGLTRGSHWHGMRYLLGVLTKRHTRWADVLRFQSRRMWLESDERMSVQLDGDYAGRLPMEIQVVPSRVTLRLPNLTAVKRPFPPLTK